MTRATLRIAVPSIFRLGHFHPAGTVVTVLEPLGETRVRVEVRVPDDSLEGGAWFDCIDVEVTALLWPDP